MAGDSTTALKKDEPVPARRGFLRSAVAAAAAPVLPGAAIAPAAVTAATAASATATTAVAGSGIAAALGLNLAKLLLAQNSHSYVVELLRKGAELTKIAEGKLYSPGYIRYSLDDLRRFHVLPGHARSAPGIDFSILAELGFSTTGDLFSREMQFFLDRGIDPKNIARLLEVGEEAVPKTPNPNLDDIQQNFKDFAQQAGVTVDMPIKEAVTRFQQQQIRSHLEGLRKMAMQNSPLLPSSLIEAYTNPATGLDKEALQQALEALGFQQPPVKAAGEQTADPFASFRESLSRSITKHETLEQRQKASMLDLEEMPDHLRLFWLERKNVGVIEIREWLKEQGISEEELKQIILPERPDYIIVERGSRAEQVMLGYITSKRPETPRGWKAQEAEPTVQEGAVEGKLALEPEQAVEVSAR